MKSLVFFLVVLCGTLVANFKKEFLDEVMKFSEKNPPELVDDQVAFIQGFSDSPMQQITGKDEEVRPVYVTAQGDFERTLAFFLKEKRVKLVQGMIHTPTPATPLCTKGEMSESLVDRSMEGDQRRLYTVMKRPGIIREYLKNGGRLLIIYPEKGRGKRTPEQLAIFEESKRNHPTLYDRPLSIEALDPERIGATYVIWTNDDEEFIFSIMAQQANAPENDSTWAIWFGTKDDLEVKKWLDAHIAYFKPLLSIPQTSKNSL